MLCPKCRQPLDGEDVYICCADTTLAWRCEECGKVSEGFAFPYGMCPQCGGALSLLDPRRVEDEAGLMAVRAAFEIELGGRAFYVRAAREARDPALKQLFGKFADMEDEHMRTLARRYHVAVPEPSATLHLDRAAVFAGIDHRPDDPDTLFRVAIAFEERAVAFFTRRGDEVGPAEQQLYKELAAEEREHVALLATEYDRWRAGKPGLL